MMTSLIAKIDWGERTMLFDRLEGKDVILSMIKEVGEKYFIHISVGSPLREQYIVLETNSNWVRVQFHAGNDCYDPANPVFDPSYSATFNPISCDLEICGEQNISNKKNHRMASDSEKNMLIMDRKLHSQKETIFHGHYWWGVNRRKSTTISLWARVKKGTKKIYNTVMILRIKSSNMNNILQIESI